MKKAIMLGLAAMLSTGCDFKAPLVDHPDRPIDEALVGRWQGPETDGAPQTLLVLPWSKTEYLIVYPLESADVMFARGCLWQGPDLRLVQLHWIGTARDGQSDEPQAYQFAAYDLKDRELTVRLLNPAHVPKTAGTADELIQAITDNRTDPKLFREPMIFRRQPI